MSPDGRGRSASPARTCWHSRGRDPRRNEPQLITYVDRLAGDLKGLDRVLRNQLRGAFGGVHLLPFFYPVDGADAGFDPIDHTQVDPRLGDWSDVGGIGAGFDLMADLIVNHVSSRSPQFLDWEARGDASPCAGMFLTFDAVYPDGASDDELAGIYRPRPGLPFTTRRIAGVDRQVWTTFTADQIDIDVDHPAAWAYLLSVLDRFGEAGVDVVRLDAVGYAVKKPGTSSFMIPETFAFIERLGGESHQRGMRMLVEIHSHYRTQIAIASKVDLVYDFALPPLVLHALHTADAAPLEHWLAIRPSNCVTVLDTHDGIGVVDVAPQGELPGLLEPAAVDQLVESIHDASEGRSRLATGAAASNLDLYQVNCSLYEAVGSDDAAHLLARLIQVLVPGVPQVYYGGLLAAPNDLGLLARTGVGRDINRPYYDPESLAAQLRRAAVADMINLLRWRKAEAELFGGDFFVAPSPTGHLAMGWSTGHRELDVTIDLADRSFELTVDGQTYTSVVQLGA
jgi:sucrose phosphorylase